MSTVQHGVVLLITMVLVLIGLFIAIISYYVNKTKKDTPKSKQILTSGKSASIQFSCAVCKKNSFRERKTMMNTKLRTFFSYDFTNHEAMNYICNHCGYITWFIDKPIVEIED